MSLLRNLSDGLRSLFRRQRVEGELHEELRRFLEMAAEEKMKEGMSRQDYLVASHASPRPVRVDNPGAARSRRATDLTAAFAQYIES